MSKVAVVIPMYGHHEMTKKCIDLTLENAGMSVDIVVVDDCSPDPFIYDHEKVYIKRLATNHGFTGAANEGILCCGERYPYIHLLNNDTEPKKDFIKILYDVMEKYSTIGIACSARILKNGQEHNLELFGADLIRGYQKMTTETQELPEIVYSHWIPLCSAMLRFSMVREIGLLDRRMRTWCSDNAYCMDAIFRGYGVALVAASRVYHIHQVTTGTHNEEGVKADQQVLLQKITNMHYAQVLQHVPLDCESNTYGKLTFETYKK